MNSSSKVSIKIPAFKICQAIFQNLGPSTKLLPSAKLKCWVTQKAPAKLYSLQLGSMVVISRNKRTIERKMKYRSLLAHKRAMARYILASAASISISPPNYKVLHNHWSYGTSNWHINIDSAWFPRIRCIHAKTELSWLYATEMIFNLVSTRFGAVSLEFMNWQSTEWLDDGFHIL